MKKLLIGTTALVAAGFIAAPAMAADPIKLNVGGFHQQWVGWSSNDSGYENSLNTATQSSDHKSFDIKSNSEIRFTGSTVLDNGITAGVQVHLETERHQTTNVDNSNLFLSSPTLGTLRLGHQYNAPAQMLVGAPNPGNSIQNSGGRSILGANASVVQPTAVSGLIATWDQGSVGGISYVTPSFSGFSAAAAFAPSATNSNNQPAKNEADQWSAALRYSGSFDGVGVNAFVGHADTRVAAQSVQVTNNVDGIPQGPSYNDTNAGLSVSYAGFTVGGSYLQRNSKGAATDGHSYELGIQYATGPYAIGLQYYKSEVQGAIDVQTDATRGDDEISVYAIGGSYNMGPGVDLRGTVARVKYEDEQSGVAGNNNKGTNATVGVTLTF